MKEDYRPSLWVKDAENIRLINYRAKVAKGVEPYVLHNVEGFKEELSEGAEF